MTRREVLDLGRLALLRLRVRIAQSLPVALMTFLKLLDRWSAERAVDRPWTTKASHRLDRILEQKDGER